MSFKIFKNHNFEEYSKKYGKKQLKKVSKSDADRNPSLLENNAWWLIDDTYYQVSGKGIKFWWNNLSKTGKIVACALTGAAVVTAVVVPTIITLTRGKGIKSQSVIISSDMSDVASIKKVELDKDSNNVITVTPKDTRNQIESATVKKGDIELKQGVDYLTQKIDGGGLSITVYKSACELNNDNIIITPAIKAVEYVTLNKTSITLPLGSSEILIAKVNPAGTPIKWLSNDSNIAKVEQSGKVIPVSIGVAYITVHTDNGLYASCKVTVTGEPVREMKAYVRTQNFDIDNSSGYQIVCMEGETILEGDISFEFRKNGFLCENILTLTSDGKVKCFDNCDEGGDIEITAKKPHFNDAKVNVCVGSYGKLGFTLNSDTKEASIKAIDIVGETANNLVIPSSYYGGDGYKYKITKIEDHAFENSPLTSVYIPNTITEIGNYAFSLCGTGVSLTRIVFESNSNLTTIGDYAFSYLRFLKYLEIPGSVTHIGVKAFGGEQPTKLTKVFVDSSYVANLIEETLETSTFLYEYTNKVEVNKNIVVSEDSYLYKNYVKGETVGDYVEYTMKADKYIDFVLNAESTAYSVKAKKDTCDKTPLNLVIPNVYNEKPITEIPDYAFNNGLITNFSSIEIPVNVNKIGFGACKRSGSSSFYSFTSATFLDTTHTWTIYKKQVGKAEEESTPVQTEYNPSSNPSLTASYLSYSEDFDWGTESTVYYVYRWVKNNA